MSKKAVETPTPVPQLTFTSDEVNKLTEFVNLVYTSAEFKANVAGMKKIMAMINDVGLLCKKMEAHIFEHIRTFTPKG